MRKEIFFCLQKIILLFCTAGMIFLCGCGDRKQNKSGRINKIQDLNSSDIVVGCMTGIEAERVAKAKLPHARFMEYSMPIDAFTAICANKIDAVILDRPTLEFMSLAHPELAVMKEDLAIGHISVATKKDSELISQINDFIRKYRKDGTYQQMCDRWFHTIGASMPNISSGGILSKPLKVGVTANNEPLCFIKNGELAGFDAEFALRLGDYLNRKIEFVDMPYDALVIALQSGKIHVAVAFMDALAERKESASFSECYIDAPITALIHRKTLKSEKLTNISCLQDLNTPACNIAVQSEILATKEGKKRLPDATFLDFAAPPDCYAALSSGKAQAVVYDRPALEHSVLAKPDFFVLPEDITIGHISVAADNRHAALIDRVNQFIRQYRKDGTYQKMYDRWIYSTNPVMPKIGKPAKPDGTLVVGIDSTNPPMCYVQDGKETGFDIEFAERLALFLNKAVKYVVLPYEGLVPAMKGGKIDLAIAQMDATPERRENILFSTEYIDSPVAAMILKKNYSGSMYTKLADLKEKKVGTLTGTAYEQLAKPYMPEYIAMSFSQLNQAVAALESGKIDALFADEPIGRFLLLQRSALTVLPQKIPCGDYAFLFSKKSRKLRDKISGEIRKMKQDGTLKQLQDKWFSAKTENIVMAEPIKSNKELVFSVVPEIQPFVYVSNGKIVGYDVETAILAANHLGYHLNVVIADFTSFVEHVNSGKSDFSGGCVAITKEREESVLFSEPNYDGGISLIVRKTDNNAVSQSCMEWIRDSINSLAGSLEKTFIRESRWKLILQGLFTTIVITFFAVVFGTLFAFPVCMMCRSKSKLLSWFGEKYVSIIMGTPILVILMILYYVIFAKVDISGIVVAILAFAMDFAAYTSVTLRSGIEGIPHGQTEAALALGHRPAAAFFRFVLPQAVRSILPVYRGEIISTLKSTSVVGYIAIMDLTKMGDIIRSRTYEAFFPLIAIALIYFLTAKVLTSTLLIVEDKLNPDTRRNRLQKRGVK